MRVRSESNAWTIKSLPESEVLVIKWINGIVVAVVAVDAYAATILVAGASDATTSTTGIGAVAVAVSARERKGKKKRKAL